MYVNHYDLTNIPDKFGNTGYSNYFFFNGFAGKLKYLTQICFVSGTFFQLVSFHLIRKHILLQDLLTIYYWIALACDLFHKKVDTHLTAQTRGKLKITRDYLFNVVLFPVALLVVIVFWILYNINRDLIFPKHLDEYIPPWVNHSWVCNILTELHFFIN